jgi:hypothetical protein
MQTELNALPERYFDLYNAPPVRYFTITYQFHDQANISNILNIYIYRERERD